jgi:hypothetical protein
LLFASLRVAPSFAQSIPPGADEGAEAMRRSEKALEQGRMDEAYEILSAAWKRKKTYDIAANLGSLELRMSKARDAAEHLTFSLHEYPPSADARIREKLQGRLGLAKREIGVLRIDVSVERADVTIDGQSVGQSPISGERFVEPGARVVEARLTGYQAARQTTDVAKGSETHILLTLAPELTGSPSPPSTIDLSTSRRSTAPLVIGGIVTGIGVLAGTTFLALAESRASTADDRQKDIQARGGSAASCYAPAADLANSCNGLSTANREKDSFRKWEIASFAMAGVAAGAAVTTYFLLSPIKSSAHLTTTPYVARDSGGIWLSGDF